LLRELVHCPDMQVSVLTPTAHVLPAGADAATVRRWAPGRFQALEHALRLAGDIRRVPTDVFFSPALDPPRSCDRPWVQTLHDVTPLLFDHPGYAADRRRWHRWGARMREADAIVAVSEYTARQGVAQLGLDPTRIHVVHEGVDPRFRPPVVRNTAAGPFLLYVGEFGPNKGFEEAFETAGRMAGLGYPHPLKVVGRIAPWVAAEIEELRRRAPRPERIETLGYVGDQELAALYQDAAALVVTSRQEGFGLPAVEAMASGLPVVAFDNSATTEVVGGGGTLVPDGDVPALVTALAAVLDDDAAWREASEAGLRRAREFSWARCAAAHAQVFRSVAAN
jgi:alpha-1,3-rhamnosyl/mannosyltransferase